jgi:predicted RNA binding protein YcfA (HicA-like mRNA interferase family)
VIAMAPIKTKKIITSLEKKGFVASESDHVMLFLYVNNKKTNVHTKISHGSKEYGDKLLNMVKKELKLENRNQLDDLINCPMSYDKYIGLLSKNKHIQLQLAPEIPAIIKK